MENWKKVKVHPWCMLKHCDVCVCVCYKRLCPIGNRERERETSKEKDKRRKWEERKQKKFRWKQNVGVEIKFAFICNRINKEIQFFENKSLIDQIRSSRSDQKANISKLIHTHTFSERGERLKKANWNWCAN